MPTALLLRFGVRWVAQDERHVIAYYRLNSTEVELRCTLDRENRIRSVVFDRWGDPENTGNWRVLPFGFKATEYATFEGVTIPSAVRAG